MLNNNGTPRSSYSLIYWLGKYATEWALVRGTFDWGVLDEKRTHPNTDIERLKWDFGPTVLSHPKAELAHLTSKGK
jgi:hypothetical protein